VGERDSAAGTVSTASGLVFFGDNAQALEAVDAKTGVPLWHFTMGQSIRASPMSYAVLGNSTWPLRREQISLALHCRRVFLE